MPETYWLPKVENWSAQLREAERVQAPSWAGLMRLAAARLDFLQVDRLDRLARRTFPQPPAELQARPVRLAVLGSSTTAHLAGSIRVAGLRRGLWVDVHQGEYGQYMQALLGGDAALEAFAPTAILLALDARHLTAGVPVNAPMEEVDAAIDRRLGEIESCWRAARERFGAVILQQSPLPVLPALLGENERRLAGSPAAMLARIAEELPKRADAAGVHLVAVDRAAQRDGIRAWHDPVLWHRAKQEVSPAAAPVYGDLVARLLAAVQGRTSKCLVLDLDNTLWGGVIGDDGLDGIVLGQGSALGEAFVAVQDHARGLAARGVILAVCSKNDEAVALAAFEQHSEMTLKRSDIAAFVANWEDKASNLRRIAAALNIGLDALVFVDDNPFERNLVRTELPQVAVPEVPDDDPAAIPQLLADAGYFEMLAVTADDLQRGEQYRANEGRRAAEAAATDLPAYLRSLDMTLGWRRFDEAGLARIVQLINKTNQFNLTTRRLSTEEVRAIMADPRSFGLQFRLRDRFGDNGMVAVVTGHVDETGACRIDDWLMSCRVLGRDVERAMLDVVAAQAESLGARLLVGSYRTTEKNGMVRDLYPRLGFEPHGDGFALALEGRAAADVPMRIMEEV